MKPRVKYFLKGGAMQVVAFRKKSQVLAEQYGWSLDSAEGYVDGETFRKRRKSPAEHFLVGIDDYSNGFRAGYFDRPLSEYTFAARSTGTPGVLKTG
jgi:hypothetical protein